MFALKQTCSTMKDMATYLLQREFKYVLLGQFTSDPLEHRFGWYRQLSGAKYYITVKDILESENKIRIKSLVKFSNMDFSDIVEMYSTSSTSSKEISEMAEHLFINKSLIFGEI